jgi:hypothetical protein
VVLLGRVAGAPRSDKEGGDRWASEQTTITAGNGNDKKTHRTNHELQMRTTSKTEYEVDA